jgi:PAS domain S-box-containing protein
MRVDSTTKHKILIVDDAETNVAVLKDYLAKDYDVISASNGNDALELVKTEKPDLILLDVIMPVLDGFKVCKIIKRDYKMDFVPVVMLTALKSKEDHHKGIEAGADDFLKKPVEKFELQKKIASLLRIKDQHDSLLRDLNKAYDYLDYVGVLIAVLDKDYKLIHINKKGAELLGYKRKNILNRPWIDLFVADDHMDRVTETYDNLQKGLIKPYEYHEYKIITITGKQKLYKWYDSPLTDENGKVYGIVISGEDITDKRNSEIKLQEYADQLKRSNDLKDLFTDILRHDLLNPAGLTMCFTEILEDTELDEKQRRILTNIKKSNQKLIELTEDAAHLAKLESMDNIEFSKVNLESIIKDCTNSYLPDMKNKGISVDFLFNGAYPALANPIVERVFSNLLSNAIKYSNANTVIKITIEDLHENWKIGIIDQGDGIPDKDKDAVFDRFKRLHKENIRGSGIGLAIVKRIVDLHNEHVWVTDNPEGKGSIFWVTLKKA